MLYINNIILMAIIATVVQCGVIMPRDVELEGRILGGEDTTIENHPYQVSVRIFNIHFCGGSIVKEDIVITAAHCIYSFLPAAKHSVQYGASVVGVSKNVIIAERVLQHESFNSSIFRNDVALIFLVSKIPFSAVAKPIQLTSEAPAAGVSAVVTGWGAMFENGLNAPILQEVFVEIFDSTTCQIQYRGINKITEAMLCAGVNGGGKDACKRDSGGPLVSNGQLVGIVSFGNGCGDPNYPGVYSNVAVLKNWIDVNMALYEQQINLLKR